MHQRLMFLGRRMLLCLSVLAMLCMPTAIHFLVHGEINLSAQPYFTEQILIMLFFVYYIWNIAVCLLFCLDKSRAETDGKRVCEKTLLRCIWCMGAVGAEVGMVMFRHMQDTPQFQKAFLTGILINTAVVLTVLKVVLVVFPV